MRQAATIALLVLCAVPCGSSGGDGPPPGEPAAVARARELIRSGDRRGAVTVLEDALLDGPAGDRPSVVALLRRSYSEMAREAEASGDAAAAAESRDNLAILERAHPADRPRIEGPRVEAPRPRSAPPVPARAKEKGTARPDPVAALDPESIQAPSAGEDPPSREPLPELRGPIPPPGPIEPMNLPVPMSLPEPAPMPANLAGPGRPKSDDAVVPAGMPAPGSGAGRLEPLLPNKSIDPSPTPGPSPSARPAEAPAARPDRSSRAAQAPAPRPAPAATDDLAAADKLFRAQDFDGAGRIYSALSARRSLPEDRRPHWAYCRMKAVVRRINANPRSMREWDAIEAEVRAIQQLTPKNWYGEYLMNLVTETRRSRRRRSPSAGNVVVRGSSPDGPEPAVQPPVGRRQPRSRAIPGAPPTAPPSPAPSDRGQSLILPGSLALPEAERGPSASVAAPAGAPEGGQWEVHESANFRVYHRDKALAERAAAVAESVRSAQARRWGTDATRADWTPRCELYLYPTGKDFAEATGQPATAPGLSTISNDGSRVVARRMSLRADNRLLLTATLPHEVTHVVLADLFVAQPIPRWADEGLAVLAEPEAELRHRQADLKGPLDEGRVFEAGRLLAMDYPDPKEWRLFYAQSVSMTRFLVEQGPSARFVQFLREAQRMGTEAALRDVYRIDGVAALHEQWLDYARKQAGVDLASSRGAADARRD